MNLYCLLGLINSSLLYKERGCGLGVDMEILGFEYDLNLKLGINWI